jgi:hypothetical protein
MRKLILALLVAGMAGLLAELYLLDHYELLWQWAPILALLAGLALAVAVAVKPSPATLRPFQVVMTLFVLVGLVGVGLHLAGNLEFEREMDPSAGGLELFREALSGAFPSLAPGALVQLGLLGLIHAWKHPVLGESGGDETTTPDDPGTEP